MNKKLNKIVCLSAIVGVLTNLTVLEAKKRKYEEAFDDAYCRECCKKGRWLDKGCAVRCNRCDFYNDQAHTEAKDFPA